MNNTPSWKALEKISVTIMVPFFANERGGSSTRIAKVIVLRGNSVCMELSSLLLFSRKYDRSIESWNYRSLLASARHRREKINEKAIKNNRKLTSLHTSSTNNRAIILRICTGHRVPKENIRNRFNEMTWMVRSMLGQCLGCRTLTWIHYIYFAFGIV